MQAHNLDLFVEQEAPPTPDVLCCCVGPCSISLHHHISEGLEPHCSSSLKIKRIKSCLPINLESAVIIKKNNKNRICCVFGITSHRITITNFKMMLLISLRCKCVTATESLSCYVGQNSSYGQVSSSLGVRNNARTDSVKTGHVGGAA